MHTSPCVFVSHGRQAPNALLCVHAPLHLEVGALTLPATDCTSWLQADARVNDGSLGEISGIASSMANPGYIWVHEDSGGWPNPPGLCLLRSHACRFAVGVERRTSGVDGVQARTPRCGCWTPRATLAALFD